ncbi:MAG: hypothetical protein KKC46_11245 [Proteobacteria bacterium]|nr:hypothetical protein [Pseudomonadota bacterium]
MIKIIIGCSLAILIVGALAVYIIRKKRKTKEAMEVVEKIIKPAPEQSKPEDAIEGLVGFNVFVRDNIHQLSDEVVLLCEQIVDTFRDILPKMMERYPEQALTYELRRASESHLLRKLKEYCDMSDTNRTERSDVLVNLLRELLKHAVHGADIIERNELDEFDTVANFMKMNLSGV